MKIKTEFENSEEIPKKFTADGVNVNPKFVISGIPSGTKSLVLVVEDPDAKRVVGHTFIHWVVFDIPVNSDKIVLEENSIFGIVGKSNYNWKEYGGPNPPKGSGVHHYHFQFYALSDFLNLPEMSALDKIKEKMKNFVVDKAEIIGVYSGG